MIRFVTTNKGKFREAKRILADAGMEIEMLSTGYPEIQAESLKEVVLFGLEWLRERVEGSVLIEDSGLFIESLGGFPGVFSSYVYQTVGLEGVLELMASKEERSARFESCVGFLADDLAMTFSGICEGAISREKKGARGFGYDPIFIPRGETRTFGEMGTDEKNRISHRGRAFRKLIDHLQA